MSENSIIELTDYCVIAGFILAMIVATIIPMRFSKKAVASRNEDSDSIRNLHRDVRDAQEDFNIPSEKVTEFLQYLDTLTSDKGRKDAVKHFVSRAERKYKEKMRQEADSARQ